MNSDNIKGSIDDAAGRVKRQVGEWTGNTGDAGWKAPPSR